MLKCHVPTALLIGSLFIQGCALDAPETEQKAVEQKNTTKEQSEVLKSNIAKQDYSDKREQRSQANMISLTGVIHYQSFEGGFYSFIADNGAKYTPIGLAKEYRKHGLAVAIEGQIMRDVMTTTQFGEVLKVITLKIIDDSQYTSPKTEPSEL